MPLTPRQAVCYENAIIANSVCEVRAKRRGPRANAARVVPLLGAPHQEALVGARARILMLSQSECNES